MKPCFYIIIESLLETITLLFSNSNSDNILGFVNTSLGMSPLIMFLNPSENEVFITPFGAYINVFPSIKFVFFYSLIP